MRSCSFLVMRTAQTTTHKETKNGFYKPQDTPKTWQWMWIFLLWLLCATNLDLSRLDFIKCTGRLGILLVKSVLRLIINQNFLCPLWIIWAREFWILLWKKQNKTKQLQHQEQTNKNINVLNSSWMTVFGQRCSQSYFYIIFFPQRKTLGLEDTV